MYCLLLRARQTCLILHKILENDRFVPLDKLVFLPVEVVNIFFTSFGGKCVFTSQTGKNAPTLVNWEADRQSVPREL